MSDDLVKILDGNTFVVSDSRGDIEASLTDPTGLFSFDTRFLSKWVLTVNGQRLNPLSVEQAGQLIAHVGIAPAEPLEFIVLELARDGDTILTTEEN